MNGCVRMEDEERGEKSLRMEWKARDEEEGRRWLEKRGNGGEYEQVRMVCPRGGGGMKMT
ncbi:MULTISPECIES: hypothetical protein [unclassified Bartonella]|uniref:hypothetical protein n=1 Tax=unclassified Bartonella TaxID=2645622 RepID=UPI0035D0C878